MSCKATYDTIAQRQRSPRIGMTPNVASVVTLLIGNSTEAQTIAETLVDAFATSLYHHIRRNELVIGTQLDVVVDPVKGQHQMQPVRFAFG